ncbi:hypothetical protein ONZ45_g7172 [Pleurotus djamor]|nr:hypothetical protein ONZ45_g7172 [Pleurotus djamor]
MAAVNLSSSPITQVSQTPVQTNLQPQLLTRLLLDLRGRRFEVDRETIMNLPESVLLCLFPNGLVLSRQSVAMSDGGDAEEEEEVYGVDFDPDCFQYVLTFFRNASEAFYGTATSPGLFSAQQHLLDGSPPSEFGSATSQNPLLSKQAIIVLREELEYFSIPPKESNAATDQNGLANETLVVLKRKCGDYLMDKRNIFTALQRNVNKENNLAEQHLIDMLCMSGFDREDEWGYRALEPSRCCISSIALVLLKTGIMHHQTGSNGESPVTVDYNQMATAQKLLLFWRKPARKCWWDGIDVELPEADGQPAKTVKLWARRVWTLELSLSLVAHIQAVFLLFSYTLVMSAPSITSESPPSYTSQPQDASDLPSPSSTNAQENSDAKSVKSQSTVTSKAERRSSHSHSSRRHSTVSTKSSKSSTRKEEPLKLDTSEKGTKPPHRRHSTSSSRKEQEPSSDQHDPVRRSIYGPEFLQQLAEVGLSAEAKNAAGGGNFKVVTGSEAMSIYESYVNVQEKPESSPPKEQAKPVEITKPPQQPIVFAFTASDGARKVIDYYMTWKGKARTRPLKGPERKASFLNAEFNKVAEALDSEYKRLSILGEAPFETVPQTLATPSAQPVTEPNADLPTDTVSPAKPVPPPINPPKPSDVIEPARLSASSVVSLPLLNMIRGVPMGNRLPLFVTNPDPSSSSTTCMDDFTNFRAARYADLPCLCQASIRGSIIETAGTGKEDALADATQRPKTPENSSSNDRYKPKKSSPLAVSRSPSENSGEDSSKSESSEKSHKHRMGSRSASRSPASGSPTRGKEEKDKSSEILIVLLPEGEKSDHTWHGLERKLTRRNTKSSRSSRTASGERYSPWLGPLVAADKVTIHPSRKRTRIGPLRRTSAPPPDSSSSLTTSSSSDDEDDDDDDYAYYPALPVVPALPIKTFLINEGLLPPDTKAEQPVTTFSTARATSGMGISVAGSAYSYHSPYVASIDVTSVNSGGYARGPTPPYPPANYGPYPSGAAPVMAMPMSRPTKVVVVL